MKLSVCEYAMRLVNSHAFNFNTHLYSSHMPFGNVIAGDIEYYLWHAYMSVLWSINRRCLCLRG